MFLTDIFLWIFRSSFSQMYLSSGKRNNIYSMAKTKIFPCLYCKNPRPEITFYQKQNSGYSVSSPITKYLPAASVNGIEEAEIHKPPKVNCNFCKRQYLLLANQGDIDFFDSTYSKLKLHNSLFAIMKKANLLLEDIEKGYFGITHPQVSFYKLSEKNQYHIIFHVKKKIYYLICKRNSEGNLIATGLQVVD
jgi:hypothetical protein